MASARAATRAARRAPARLPRRPHVDVSPSRNALPALSFAAVPRRTRGAIPAAETAPTVARAVAILVVIACGVARVSRARREEWLARREIRRLLERPGRLILDFIGRPDDEL